MYCFESTDTRVNGYLKAQVPLPQKKRITNLY